MADSTAATRSGRRPHLWVPAVASFVVVAVVMLGWLRGRGPVVPPEEPTVELGQLQRVDGVLCGREEGHRAFSGWVIENYGEGRPKSRSHVVNGRLEGVSEGWHPNGVLRIQEHFAGGLSDGLVTRWNPDGSKLSEGTSRAGKFEGLFRRWHPNGALAEELEMAAGEPHGRSRSWYPNGNPKAEARMEMGKVVERKFWPDAGQPQLVTRTTDGGKS